MAAKAEPESTGDEIWFNDAVTERVDTWGSEEDAEQALVRDLKNGWPWSHLLPDGTRVPGDAKFWNEPFVNVDRKANRAKIGVLISNTSPFWRDGPSDVPGQVVGIKVARSAVPASKRKPGPGTEQTYDYAALAALANRVLARGRPDTKQVFFDQVRADAPKGLKLPSKDYPTLNRIIGHLWDAGRPSKG